MQSNFLAHSQAKQRLYKDETEPRIWDKYFSLYYSQKKTNTESYMFAS